MANTRTILIAGSTSGIGDPLAEALARTGNRLVFLNRNAQKTETQIHRLRKLAPGVGIFSYQADFANRSELAAAAATIMANHPVIDWVFYNAGVLLGDMRFSPQGNEMHFEVNTVAPYALLHRLRPAMARAGKSAFVVSGSGARSMARVLDVDGLQRPKVFKKMVGPYAQSKQATTAAMHALAPDFAADGIGLRVVDLMPTRTPMVRSGGMPAPFRLLGIFFASPRKSARRLIAAATEAASAGAGLPEPARNLPEPAVIDRLVSLMQRASGIASEMSTGPLS